MAEIELNVYNASTAATQALNSPSTTARTVTREYRPLSPEWDGDRGEWWPTVEETAIIRADTYATARTLITTLNQWFSGARHRQTNRARHAGVFVQYRPQTSETLYRSPVITGRAVMEQHWGPAEVRVTWTRASFWEANSESAVPWASGSNPQSLTMTPGSNVVALTAASISGDLPAPVRWEVYNNYNNAAPTRDIHLGALLGSAGTFNGLLECESGTATISPGSGSNSASGSASGGNYHTVTVYSIDAAWFTTTPDDPTYYTRIGWALSTSALNTINGRAVKPHLRFFTRPSSGSGIQIAWAVRYDMSGSGTRQVIYQTDWQDAYNNTPYNLLEGPALHIPPRHIPLAGGDNVNNYELLLLARKVTASDSSIAVDYVQLLPTDGYNHWYAGWLSYQDTAAQDDAIEVIVSEDSTNRSVGYYNPHPPVFITPGETARFYLLQQGGTVSEIARTLQLSGYYRPRRLTV
jgi:hypothetical protein